MYDQLSKFYPEVQQYKLYHAQSLYKGGMYNDAAKIAQQIETPEFQDKVQQLQIAIQYELEEINHAKSLIQSLGHDSPEALIATGCMLYKEEKFDEARAKF